MVTSSAPSSALGSALRRKFRTPREAMRALGLDARLLGKDNTEAENERQRRSLTVEQCMELSEFLKSVVDDETFEKIDRFLKKAMDDASIEEQTGEPQDNVRGFLKERGMADDDIQAVLDMVPGSGENGTGKNGIFGGQGGRFSDPRPAMDGRRPVLAMDAAATKRLHEDFPMLARIGQTWDGNVDRRDNN